MKAIALATVISGLVVACATGTYGPGDTNSSHGDGGIISKGDSGTPKGQDAGTKPVVDSGNPQPPTCNGTMCGADCVDTSSDPNNCGACGNPCDLSSTCTGGQCVPNQTQSGEPPVGTCGHSLCTSGNALIEGCDPAGCNTVICDPQYLDDEYCCDTSWDSQCIDEVNQYCAPYSCN
ncbi:MAG TPA: hypothetical protein VGH28_00840 [Polyangiaceae bacterium]|jgi:hypothetical protein